MLVSLKKILDMAEEGGYAIPAFNVYNTETLMGIAKAAEEARSPVIIQLYSRLFQNEEGYYVSPSVLAAAEKLTVPVCYHIDHGANEGVVARALRYGVSGVMIDASALDYEDNIAVTRHIVEIADAVGVETEGELGHVGSVNDNEMDAFTDPDEAADFVKRTGVAALAVMVGTAHGRYKKPPKLDLERIAAIKEKTGIPLVLHGGSGIPDDQIQAAIKNGIRKINFGTDVCFSFLDEVFASERNTYAIDLFMRDPVESVKKFALSKIKLLGSEGKA